MGRIAIKDVDGGAKRWARMSTNLKRFVEPFPLLPPMGTPIYEQFVDHLVDLLKASGFGDLDGRLFVRTDQSPIRPMAVQSARRPKVPDRMVSIVAELFFESCAMIPITSKPKIKRRSTWQYFDGMRNPFMKINTIANIIDELNAGKPLHEAFLIGYRYMGNTYKDGKPKERWSVDIDDRPVLLTRPLKDSPGGYPRSTCRTRAIYMGNALNTLGAILAYPLRMAYLKRFAHSLNSFEVEHRLPADGSLIGLDAKEFDKNTQLESIQLICSIMQKYMPKNFNSHNVVWDVHVLASNCQDSVKIYTHDSIDDLYHKQPNGWFGGLYSGTFSVSDIGKILGISAILNALVPNATKADVEAILKGEGTLHLFSAGDDNLLWCPTDARPEFISALNTIQAYDIEIEDEISYLGKTITGRGVSYPNITSFFVNRVRPESSGSEYMGVALAAIDDIFAKHPRFVDARHVLSTAMEDVLKISLDKYMALFNKTEGFDVKREPLNLANALFIENPDRIFYKLDPDLIDPRLVSEHFIDIDYAPIAKALGGVNW